jgi:hypothetical protein
VRLYYVSHSKIPDKKANSIQVMQMCQAFSKAGNAVTLFCIQGNDTPTVSADVFKHYGVTRSFEIQKLRKYRIRWLDRVLYGLSVYFPPAQSSAGRHAI